MRLRSVIFVLAISLLVLCSPHGLNAQTTTSGGLTGVVSDPSEAVVPDALVEIRDSAKGTVQSAKTDRDGVYRFYFLTPSRYTLTVTHDRFRKVSRTVNVLLGPPGTLNVALEIETSGTAIRVTGEAPLVHAENGDVATTLNQKQISEVPNPGNDLTYIAQITPGAVMNTDTIGLGYLGNVSILGMPGTSNLFTLNGMNNNNTQQNTNNSGALGMMLGQNEVQEATVVSNGYSAQFSGAAGANISYITKSGGNDFHGNASYYWNGRALNANDWIDNAEGNPRPFDIANQWAGSLGGPIIKNKLFFFFDTEGMHLVLPSPTYVILPSALFEAATIKNIDSVFGNMSASHQFYDQMFDLYNGTPGANGATPGNFFDPLGCNGWTNPNDPNGLGVKDACAIHFFENLYHPASESIVSGRVDWNVGAADRVFLLLQYDHGQRAAYLDPISTAFNAYTNVPWWEGQLSETHALGTAAANQFLLGGTYINQVTSVANPAQTRSLFPMVLSWGNAGSDFSNLGGMDFLYAQPAGSRTTTYQISDDLVETSGKHKLGAGLNFLRTDFSGDGFNFSGTGQIAPQTMGAFFFGGVNPANSNTDFTNLYQNFPAVIWNRLAFYTLGAYAQDEWHARSNLTLTFALRGEHQSNPVCANECFARLTGPFESINHDVSQAYNQAILVRQKQAFTNTDAIVWSPRFSFAWQPFGVAHNTVVRGGIGIFYDPVPGVLGTTFAYNPPQVNSYAIAGYPLAPAEVNSLTQNVIASNTAFTQGFQAGATLADLRAGNPNFTPPAIQALPTTLHLPQYQKWSLQVQQNFGSTTSLTVGYFGNHGIHEFVQDINANGHNFGPYPYQPCGSPAVAPCYDSRFGQVSQYASDAISNYNGMVVSFEKRINRWGSGILQINYTYGHALDEISNGGVGQFAFGSSLYPQNGNDLRGSYGPADYDVRHSLNANYVWQIPFKAALHGSGPEWLVSGWQVSGTVLARTGFPYTAVDFAESGLLAQDNVVGPIYSVPVAPVEFSGPCGEGAAVPTSPVPCLPAQVQANGAPSPGALFIQSGCETGFNAGTLPGPNGPCSGASVAFAQGRNHFRGPGYVTTDLAVMKNTNIPHWENAVFAFGLQFFNLFNHANFGFPDTLSSDSTFGHIFYQEQSPTSILGSGLNANVSARMIQVRAQLRF
jgi:hypothetical protein